MMKEYEGKIVDIHDLTKTVKNYVIELNEDMDFKAGQFINISFEENEQRFMKPYSIASNPKSDRKIELCIKLVEGGKLTPVLFEKEIGFKMKVRGPLGLFTLDHAEEKDKVVFIGAGTGISPLRSMIKHMFKEGTDKEVLLILGIRYENEILFEEEFDKLEEENPNFKFIKVISKPTDKWDGRTGHVQDNMEMIDPINSQFYVCGLELMIQGVREKLEEMGVTKEQVHFERYV